MRVPLSPVCTVHRNLIHGSWRQEDGRELRRFQRGTWKDAGGREEIALFLNFMRKVPGWKPEEEGSK